MSPGAIFATSRAVYVTPTTDSEPDGGRVLPFRELIFDGEQYHAEVERASQDRSWETVPRHTARLLRDYLDEEDEYLATLGWQRGWVAPHPREAGAVQVSLLDREGRQIVVSLSAARPGSPSQRAGEMAHSLLATPPENWPITFRGRGSGQAG